MWLFKVRRNMQDSWHRGRVPYGRVQESGQQAEHQMRGGDDRCKSETRQGEARGGKGTEASLQLGWRAGMNHVDVEMRDRDGAGQYTSTRVGRPGSLEGSGTGPRLEPGQTT